MCNHVPLMLMEYIQPEGLEIDGWRGSVSVLSQLGVQGAEQQVHSSQLV